MSRYPVYKLVPARMAELAKKEGLPKKQIPKFASLENCLKMSLSQANGSSGSSSVQNVLTEAIWMDSGREAIFIQDEDTAVAIDKLKVSNFDPTTLEHGAWMFLFPKNLGIRPFIFRVSSFKEWSARIKQKLEMDMDYAPPAGVPESRVSFGITYYHHGFTFHHSGPIDTLMDAFSGGEQFNKTMADGLFDSALDGEERNTLLKMVRFAVRTMVYSMIFPDKVLEEGPKIATTDKERPKGKTILPAFKLTGANGPTVVAPHYRQLRAERYYQGVHANKRHGTRFSVVSGHVRGTKNFATVDAEA